MYFGNAVKGLGGIGRFVHRREYLDPNNPKDVAEVPALQDAVGSSQKGSGKFEAPNWDAVSQKKVRDALLALSSTKAGRRARPRNSRIPRRPTASRSADGCPSRRSPPGGEFGVCLFEDNHQCEEWPLSRGECPVGGRRITGYAMQAGRYCAITGGQYTDVTGSEPSDERGNCVLPGGKVCEAEAYWRGACKP